MVRFDPTVTPHEGAGGLAETAGPSRSSDQAAALSRVLTRIDA